MDPMNAKGVRMSQEAPADAGHITELEKAGYASTQAREEPKRYTAPE
jgi:hypothetical protein